MFIGRYLLWFTFADYIWIHTLYPIIAISESKVFLREIIITANKRETLIFVAGGTEAFAPCPLAKLQTP